MISKKIKSSYKVSSLNLVKKKYQNGRTAVFLHDNLGEQIAELSIECDKVELSRNEFVLKDYNENSFLADDIIDKNLILPTERFVLIGSHLCPICKVPK